MSGVTPQLGGIPELLRGSWRASPPGADDDLDLASIRDQVILGGGGGLAWWTLRGSAAGASPVGEDFHNVFRIQALDAKDHERRLRIALDLLTGAGIDPVLGKGWAMAHHYPVAALRPYGDLDLFIDPAQFKDAETALAAYSGSSLKVDLHSGLRGGDFPWSEVISSAISVPFQDIEMRVLGEEHHLALLCPHMLSHGAWRPIWLVDVAVMIERDADFDWEVILSLPPKRVALVRVAVLLAAELLGARLDRTPWAGHEPLPAWVARATQRAWAREHYSTTTPLALTPGTVRDVVRGIRVRWPNPIETTMRWGRPFSNAPRWPFQWLDVGARAYRGLVEAPAKLLRRVPSD